MRNIRARSPKSSSAKRAHDVRAARLLLGGGHRILEIDAHGVGRARRRLHDHRPSRGRNEQHASFGARHRRCMSTCLPQSRRRVARTSLGVFAERGHAPMRGGDVLQIVRRKQRGNIAARRFDAGPSIRARRAADASTTAGTSFTAPVGMSAASSSATTSARGALPKSLLDHRLERDAIRDARGVRRRSADRPPAPASSSTSAQNRRHSRSVWTANITSPSAHAYAPYGTIMLCRTPARATTLPVPCHTYSARRHPLGETLEHRDVDALARAGALARVAARRESTNRRTSPTRCRRSRCRPWPARLRCR